MKLWLDQMLPRRFCVVIVTKDSDFVSLIDRFGAPPQVMWLRCGNCSNPELANALAD